jgi:RNA polymerase subunit RPABC4/transcription elongation factor Spt4
MKVILTILFVIINLFLSVLFPFWTVAVILGAIVGAIAKHKGKDFLSWWVYGTLLFIIALPHILITNTKQKVIENNKLKSGEFKKCPHCAELIKREAKICRYCGNDLQHKQVITQVKNSYIDQEETNKVIKNQISDEETKKHTDRILKKMKKDQNKNNAVIIGVLFIVVLATGYYFKDDIQRLFGATSITFVKDEKVGKYTFTQTLELTQYDVSGYSKEELRLIRNEIFARYGYIFKKNSDLDIYFRSQSWYKQNPNFSIDLLTKIEKDNATVIKKVEDSR